MRGLAELYRSAARLSLALGGLAIAAITLAPASARAAIVSGHFLGYEGQAAGPGRYLHFENAETHDIYMADIAADGAFALNLPPGNYRLRAERGAILRRAIIIDHAPLGLGLVRDLAPLDLRRLFQRQVIAPASVTIAAPATANIMTQDHTRLPPAPAPSGPATGASGPPPPVGAIE